MLNNIKGILFDKDGTLIDFYHTWYEASLRVTGLLQERFDSEALTGTALLDAIGVRDGRVDPAGYLACGTYRQISEGFYGVIRKIGLNIEKEALLTLTVRLYEAAVKEIPVRPVGNPSRLMKGLKQRGLLLGIATSDNVRGAMNCVKQLGIEAYFDYIGADDGVRAPKPDTTMLREFSEKFGLKKDEIAVVGDTVSDMRFAKAFGAVAIGTCTGTASRRELIGEADYVIENIEKLLPKNIGGKAF